VPIVVVIESAAIYVLELVILIVLYGMKHNAQFILQEALVPSLGALYHYNTYCWLISIEYRRRFYFADITDRHEVKSSFYHNS
jgi:hypothetical protein